MKSCRDMIPAQGKRGTSAALGFGNKIITFPFFKPGWAGRWPAQPDLKKRKARIGWRISRALALPLTNFKASGELSERRGLPGHFTLAIVPIKVMNKPTSKWLVLICLVTR